MLEKIGLPAKPSMRGNNWVVDASHCQGCASQFTFINRKHHCRRCGGLFCGNCTQQRMFLRGQGDSPVRICEPCKKLEDAARFEMRHAHKTRAARGSTKLASTIEDEILGQIIGNEGKKLSSLQTSIERVSSSSSCSPSQGVAHLDEGGEVRKSHSLDHPNSIGDDLKSTSPEELRQWASDEKKRYKVLKGEGKSDEALKAFKRGKELERQADALEISLRKNRRRVLTAGSPTDISDKDSLKASGRRSKLLGQGGEEKEDLMAELKELGWSDIGSRGDDKKQKNMSLEGELSSLLGEIPQRSVKHVGIGSMDKSQVVAHKKMALALKREGNLAEAKEELKKAKVLEKLLEEQELLGAAEDSDDEISTLIRSMGDDKQDELLGYEQDHGFEFDHLVGSVDNIGTDANVEVTDEDLMDPEITATLKSLGWTDNYGIPEDSVGLSPPIDREALSSEILSLKREALNQKRAGNASEAMVLLKKAKLLERDLGNVKSDAGNVVGHSSKIVAPGLTYETSDTKNKVDSKPAPKSRLTIQKELLSLKRKALALKREGRVDEAEEELKKCSVLEQQLEELENASRVNAMQATIVGDHAVLTPEHFIAPAHPPVQEGEEDVTDQDMHDPAYLSLLRNLGWKDEDDDFASSASQLSKKNDNSSVQIAEHPVTQVISNLPPRKSRRSKAEIQRELLGLKRKSLALRREGKTDDAEEVLKAAKVLEAELADLEAPKQDIQVESISMKGEIVGSANDEGDAEDVTDKDMQDPALISMLKNVGWKDEEVDAAHNISAPSQRSKWEIQQDLLDLKRKALAHRRKGENDEAEELLKMAKVLEGRLEEMEGVALLANSSKDTKSDGTELLTNQEQQQSVKSVVDLSEKLPVTATNLHEQVDAFMGFGKKECDANAPSTRSADGIYAITSQSTGDSPALLGEVGFVQGAMKNQGLSSAPPTQQISNIVDLLTGDGWSGSHVPAEKQKDVPNFESNESFALEGSLTTSPKNVGIKEDATPGRRSEEMMNAELYQQRTTQTNSVKLPSDNHGNSLQQEVLARKRKAVALKRQGKLAEAREELRQAKLLEKTIGDGIPEPETSKPDLSTSMPIATTVQEKEPSPSKSAMKPLSGRDRFKLQQESLSHKRQALKLRREGRMEEAEAEFELAKALEAQLEDSASQDPAKPSVNNSDSADDVVVEDLLDPQLLSALKSIGIEDTNDVSPVHERPRDSQKPGPLKVSPGKGDTTSQERIQLEERIRAEKVKALNLKRSGQQAEALGALRRAKLLEKKLNELGSG